MPPGARNKFGASMFEPEVCRKQMHCIEESTCDTVATFWHPRSDSAPGELCPPCPSLVTTLLRGLHILRPYTQRHNYSFYQQIKCWQST